MTSDQLIGFLGVFAILACWTFAFILYRVSPSGSVARKLSVLLVVEGFTLATAGFPQFALGLPQTADGEPSLYDNLSLMLHTIGDAAMLALYPAFLAVALKTPLTQPFGTRRAQVVMLLVGVGFVFAVALSPLRVGATILYGMLSLLFGYALIASINAWFVARGVDRSRARSFTIAFGIRDVLWSLVYAASIWMVWTDTYIENQTELTMQVKLLYALGTLLAVPLIAYGILRSHLFDIDLKVQWTIKQSTLAAIVVTLVFLVSEGADRLLSEELGNWAGLLAAAVVVYFLAPLQSFAERVASAAMPNTENTREYAIFRKMQVYEEAVSEAHYEGGISDKERALLIRLRDSLGISESDAESIEREITSTTPGLLT